MQSEHKICKMLSRKLKVLFLCCHSQCGAQYYCKGSQVRLLVVPCQRLLAAATDAHQHGVAARHTDCPCDAADMLHGLDQSKGI